MTPGNAPMPTTRRRAIPGMTSPAAAAPAAPPPSTEPPVPPASATDSATRSHAPETGTFGHRRQASIDGDDRRRSATDYGSTRLVNFRIPVDLHDRFKRLVREVEDRHPRLRHPSLTEVLIGLLEEGPDTADEIAAVIRRKRAAEHGTEDPA